MGLGQAAVCPWPGDRRCRPRVAQSASRPAPCLRRLRLGFIGREKAGPASGCWAPRPSLVLLGSQAVRAVDFAAQAPHGCWAAGPTGLRVQGCRLRLGLTSASTQLALEVTLGAAGGSGKLGSCNKAGVPSQKLDPDSPGLLCPIPSCPGCLGYSVSGCWPSAPPTSRPPRTHTAGLRCP